MTKLKIGIVSAVIIAGVAAPLVIQHQTQVKLRAENESLRQQVDSLAQRASENERLSNLAAQAGGSLTDGEQSELLKLRGEVGWLRQNQSAIQSATRGVPLQTEKTQDTSSSSEEIEVGRRLGLAVVQGDPDALARLIAMVKAEFHSFNTNRAKLDDTQRGELSTQTFAPLQAAFDVINKAALQTNSMAFQAISTALQTPELRGQATQSLGLLASAGNEDALEILLDPKQNGLLLSGTVGALREAAGNGNQRAIEALAVVASNEKQKALWLMAADGLGKAADTGNPVAIDALIAMSGSTNQNIRASVAAGLARAAANQNDKAAAALRQMNTR